MMQDRYQVLASYLTGRQRTRNEVLIAAREQINQLKSLEIIRDAEKRRLEQEHERLKQRLETLIRESKK